MSHHYAPAGNTYALKHYFTFKEYNRSRLSNRIPIIFSIVSTVILASLFLHISLSFFEVSGPAMNAISALASPPAAPFRGIFPDLNQLVPIAAMMAYCVYYALYWTIALTFRSFVAPHNAAA